MNTEPLTKEIVLSKLTIITKLNIIKHSKSAQSSGPDGVHLRVHIDTHIATTQLRSYVFHFILLKRSFNGDLIYLGIIFT